MRSITWARIAGLALALPVASASAGVVPQESNSSRHLPPSISESAPPAGQIDYAYDTALNRTAARFKTSLARGNALMRALTSGPAVHTLAAYYDFAGRTPSAPPDRIRISLMSDETIVLSTDDRGSLGARPVLEIKLGDTLVRYRLGIAQKTEQLSTRNYFSHVGRLPSREDPVTNAERQLSTLHVERTATAWIPLCDVLTLLRGGAVRGTVGGLEFEMNEAVVSGLRSFVAESAPSSTLSAAALNCK